ncbi:MAG: DUF350 domain-containing protein [Candidatus Micrarchaeia archaeon]
MPSTVGMLAAIAAGALELFFGLVYATSAIYLGIKLFDRLTPEIDELEELRKGNAAVAIVVAAIIIALAGIIQTGFMDFEAQLKAGLSAPLILLLVVLALVKLVWSLLVALTSLFLALKVLDTLTADMDEVRELKRRNVAVAILTAGVLLAVSFVIQPGVSAIINAPPFNAREVGAALGIA